MNTQPINGSKCTRDSRSMDIRRYVSGITRIIHEASCPGARPHDDTLYNGAFSLNKNAATRKPH
jgi:hypothetical protein